MDRGYHKYLTILLPYEILLATYVVTRLYLPWDPGWGIDFLNWHWSWPNILNQHRPIPNLPNRRHPWAKYLQQALIPVQLLLTVAKAPSPAPWSFPTDPIPNQMSSTNAGGPTISVRLQEPCLPYAEAMPNFFQQTPSSHEFSPTDVSTQWIIVNQHQGFWTRRHDPPNPSEILTVGGPLLRSLQAFPIIMIDWLILVCLFLCDLRTPFNAKRTATRFSYRLMLVLQLTLRINPRANCLNTTSFS